ncbi:STAS domain-containing protein [Actinokineospora soli]|uniref:STAS domain-containing protein n=1 Tax=Actinokineospora soli TaxID=1048753 RepID=A0ABW2TJ96_9PSEU
MEDHGDALGGDHAEDEVRCRRGGQGAHRSRGERPWREQVEEACGENSAKTLVVVDLTDVGYLSVGTAPLLIRAHYHCLHRGRRLRVAVRPGPVLNTLRLTGVHEIVALCPDLDSALKPLVASRW